MERLSDRAIMILNDLHAERLEYNSEYLPLIEAALKLAEYEATWMEPKKVQEIRNEILYSSAFGVSMTRERFDAICSAERDGRLVALPCKVGDKVYFPTLEKHNEAVIVGIRFTSDEIIFEWENYDESPELVELWEQDEFEISDIGKTVFLTREEAEDALKARQEFVGVLAKSVAEVVAPLYPPNKEETVSSIESLRPKGGGDGE